MGPPGPVMGFPLPVPKLQCIHYRTIATGIHLSKRINHLMSHKTHFEKANLKRSSRCCVNENEGQERENDEDRNQYLVSVLKHVSVTRKLQPITANKSVQNGERAD
jgi:hypothetical protein